MFTHKVRERWKSLGEFLRRTEEKAEALLVNVALAAGGAFLIRLLLGSAADADSLYSIVVAATSIGASVWLVIRARRTCGHSDPIDLLGLLALSLFTLVAVCSWLSFAIDSARPGVHYSAAPSNTPGVFVDLYLLTFLDLLPGVSALDTLSVSLPLRPLTVAGGLPVLGFKVFVVWLFFNTVLSWTSARLGSPPRTDRPAPSGEGHSRSAEPAGV